MELLKCLALFSLVQCLYAYGGSLNPSQGGTTNGSPANGSPANAPADNPYSYYNSPGGVYSSQNVNLTESENFYYKLGLINKAANADSSSSAESSEEDSSKSGGFNISDFQDPKKIVTLFSNLFTSQKNPLVSKLIGSFFGLIPNYSFGNYAADLKAYAKKSVFDNLNEKSDFIVNMPDTYSNLLGGLRESFANSGVTINQVIKVAQDYIDVNKAQANQTTNPQTKAINGVSLSIAQIIHSLSYFQSSTLFLDLIGYSNNILQSSVPYLQDKLPGVNSSLGIAFDTVFEHGLQFLGLFSSNGILSTVLNFLADNFTSLANIIDNLANVFSNTLYYIFSVIGQLPFVSAYYNTDYIEYVVKYIRVGSGFLNNFSSLFNTLNVFVDQQNPKPAITSQYNEFYGPFYKTFDQFYLQSANVTAQIPEILLRSKLVPVELSILNLNQAVSALTVNNIAKVGAASSLSLTIQPKVQYVISAVDELNHFADSLKAKNYPASVRSIYEPIISTINIIANESVNSVEAFSSKLNGIKSTKDSAILTKAVSSYLSSSQTLFAKTYTKFVSV